MLFVWISLPQFRPMVPNQQGQPFISSSQQFQPVGQGIPPPNVGMPPAHSQPLQFSQPMQQYPPRPSQPGHVIPSSQGLPMSYIQTRPIAPGPPQSQQPAAPFANQMPGLPGAAMPFSSSYSVRCDQYHFIIWASVGFTEQVLYIFHVLTQFSMFQYAPSSFVQPQNNASSMSQFQPMPHMQAPAAPGQGQPWLSSGSQSAPLVIPAQQVGQQPSVTSSTDTVSVFFCFQRFDVHFHAFIMVRNLCKLTWFIFVVCTFGLFRQQMFLAPSHRHLIGKSMHPLMEEGNGFFGHLFCDSFSDGSGYVELETSGYMMITFYIKSCCPFTNLCVYVSVCSLIDDLFFPSPDIITIKEPNNLFGISHWNWWHQLRWVIMLMLCLLYSRCHLRLSA